MVYPEPNTGCWLWVGYVNDWQYGVMMVEGKTTLAHRVSYQINKGEIPIGMLVLHSCDNTFCVNPDHLFLGSNKDNMDDMCRKFRFNSKLSHEDAQEVKDLYSIGMLQRDIALSLGVTQGNVSQILLHKTWKNL